MNNFIYKHFGAFYFIGIGGVSMSALAKYLKFTGKCVAGSDNSESEYTRDLENSGVKVEIGNEKGSIKDYDVIIYTDAVRETDFQLEEARKLNKITVPRGVLLHEISRDFDKTIAISGCHGKTTCTAMLAHIFKRADKKFCAHIGGRDNFFSNFYYCGNEFFITEACEYKRNFLYLTPDIGVVLNSEPDHLECYGSEENLLSAYLEFCKKSKTSVTLSGDAIEGDLTFGFDKNAAFSAENIQVFGGRYSFDVKNCGNHLGKIDLNVIGKHNVLNALAAVAVSLSAGIGFEKIKAGLEDFSGVERRMQVIGALNGARCIADYAHHPSEIFSTLSSVEVAEGGRLFVVFQPHTYSRTKNLFSEFVDVLSSVDNLLIYRTFSAREYFDDAGSALTLSQSVKNSEYGDTEEDIVKFLSSVKERDTVLFLGAGDIYDISKKLVSRIG